MKRERHEELTADIRVEEFIATVEYDYPELHLSMDCFFRLLENGSLTWLEAEDVASVFLSTPLRGVLAFSGDDRFQFCFRATGTQGIHTDELLLFTAGRDCSD